MSRIVQVLHCDYKCFSYKEPYQKYLIDRIHENKEHHKNKGNTTF